AFEHVAARAFVFEEPLRGRELGVIRGMTPEGELRFQLPFERPYVEWTIDGKLERKEPHLDSVLVDTDAKVLELMWRVSVRTRPASVARSTPKVKPSSRCCSSTARSAASRSSATACRSAPPAARRRSRWHRSC